MTMATPIDLIGGPMDGATVVIDERKFLVIRVTDTGESHVYERTDPIAFRYLGQGECPSE